MVEAGTMDEFFAVLKTTFYGQKADMDVREKT